MIARISAAIVGVILAFAGANKITAWKMWRDDARRQNVPTVIAVLLPGAELLIGSLLVVLEPQPFTLGIATLLLLIFTVYLTVQVLAKSVVPCACFGARSVRPPAWRDVGRNIALMALLFLAAAVS